jgi:hypothetical protein
MSTTLQQPSPLKDNTVLRFFAHFFSILFHPLFLPTYLADFLLYVHPYAFAGLEEKFKLLKLIGIFFTTAFLPLFSVFLMRKLNFINNILLHQQKDRIIPYITSMIFYFWVWYVSKNQPENPPAFTAFLLATFLANIAALLANIYFKISMHAIAVGALVFFFCWLAFNSNFQFTAYLSAVVMIAGLVCTSRFIVSNHSSKEIYTGLALGMICQAMAIIITI